MMSQPAVFRWLRGPAVGTELARAAEPCQSPAPHSGGLHPGHHAVVFALALEGFWLLSRQSLAGGGSIVGLVFDFLFLTLGVLLVFSGGLILYGSLFTSRRPRFFSRFRPEPITSSLTSSSGRSASAPGHSYSWDYRFSRRMASLTTLPGRIG